MNRRYFIRLAAAGAATGIIAPKEVLATAGSMAGGVYYTKDAPGRWSKKVGGHLPNLEVSRGKNGAIIRVVTSHEMRGYEHYIIKHVILDQNFEFLAEKMFNPVKDKAPISEFPLGEYAGRVHVLSACNIHDTWLNLVDV